MIRRLLSAALLVSPILAAQTAKDNLHFFVNATALSAEGIWIPIDQKSHAAYEAEAELDCDKKEAMCFEASADYYSGHPHVSIVYFQIIKWDSNGIVASSADAVCTTRTLTIGFAAKHISDTREAKLLPKEKQKACETLAVPASEGWTLALKNSKAWASERDRQHIL